MAAKKETEYRFLMVGKSGSGKSSTANTIMGENMFQVGTGLASCTKTCEIRKSSKPQKGITFRVVDTPGLFDPTKSNDEITDQIIRVFANLSPGLHAILYVLKVDRYTPEERETFNQLKKMFDSNVDKYIIIIFTKGDDLKTIKKNKETLLQEANEDFKQVLHECGNRVIIFNNKKRDSNQTKELLEMVDKIWKENGEVPYSCPMQSFINVKLERRVSVRTQERIERDPKLKKLFSDMAKRFKIAAEDAAVQQGLVDETKSRKELTETMIAEKAAAKEKEEQERKEREQEEQEKQDLEEKKKLEEEEKERKRKEKAKEQELEQLRKQLDKIRLEQEMNQKVVKEKDRLKEHYKREMDEQKEKYERDEREKTKQDIAKGNETDWSQDVMKGATGMFGAGLKWATGGRLGW